MKKEMLINKIANRLGYNTAYCSEAVRDGMRADVVDFCIEYQDDLPRLDQPKIDKLIEASKELVDHIERHGTYLEDTNGEQCYIVSFDELNEFKNVLEKINGGE